MNDPRERMLKNRIYRGRKDHTLKRERRHIMDFGKLVERVKMICTSPQTEWPVIEKEQTSLQELYMGYILILAAIGPVAGFLKMSVFGIHVPLMGTYRPGLGAGIGGMVFRYIMTLAGVYLVALIVNMLAPSFGGKKDDMQALKTVAYAYTAAWVAGIALLVPWAGWLILLAGSVYSVYLLYLGLPVTMKCPPEKAVGYTAVSIIAAIILSFVISFVVGGITGGVGMMGGRSSSHMNLQGKGGFDKDSPGGKLEEWTKKMEAATKDMEKAQKSGDSTAQSEAMSKMIASAMGSDGKIETLAPERIKTFLPDVLAGRQRSDVSAERSGAVGFQFSTAKASYKDSDGNTLKAEITDMGLAKGVAALASWAGVEKTNVTENGFEKTYKKGKEMVHEQWDNRTRSGEYSTIISNRYSVKISGKAADIDTLKKAADSLNLAGLAALKDEGVTK